MNIDELTIGEAKRIASLFPMQAAVSSPPPVFDGPVVAQFIGRFVFVCNLRIEGNWCYLTNVRNIRYWESRDNGLGQLAEDGSIPGDTIDAWPNQIIPLDKLGPVMAANKEKWS